MEIVKRVSVSQNCQKYSDVIVEGTKPASKNREPVKSE